MEKYEIEIRTASEWKATGVCVGSSIKEYIRFLSEVKDSSLKGKSTSLSLGDWVWGTVDCAWKGLDCGWRRMTGVWQRSQCHRFGDQHLVDEIWERNFGEKKSASRGLTFQFLIFCVWLMYSRRRQWQPIPVLLPGKSHGWRGLVGYSPWGREELDMTKQLHFHFSLSCIGEGNGNPLQCSCLENPRDGGAWWAVVSGVAQSRTQLKRLSSSSSSKDAFSNQEEEIVLH